jgi:hypothetical protein
MGVYPACGLGKSIKKFARDVFIFFFLVFGRLGQVRGDAAALARKKLRAAGRAGALLGRTLAERTSTESLLSSCRIGTVPDGAIERCLMGLYKKGATKELRLSSAAGRRDLRVL